MSEQLAAHEDAIDRVRELADELRADVADEQQIDGQELLERLELALQVEQGP
jgi:hypothetical protein